ncbi:hypothetical protein [Clostridium botulinum]|uniref:hypothetical protein n=1 Tax=Clostridium botulinum TaxID=1491 RepID=UPI0004D6E800|nr:hypothetical protein [Clostridium botulinum]KEH96724.1 hypothetical protein Z953_13970 [Clostridium botulinum D str. 16868]KOA73268.1 hypothetical protein ADU78_13080 [Clostridium botulinum]KOA91196.1 hypothetical protein ADU76_11875 [Clostridium botulinum]KOC32923.1 hypothetical protein ADU81_10565 [Clostridium botulinum]MCD3204053.1 hypothetical protein [Clostridium botulinum C/D]
MITSKNQCIQMSYDSPMNQCMKQCMSKCMNQYLKKNPCNASGSIKITNSAAYVASFSVGYTYHGNFQAYDSPNLKPTQSYTIHIPKGATQILFLAQYYISTSSKKTILRMEFTEPPKKCFKFTGVLFHANCVEVPC